MFSEFVVYQFQVLGMILLVLGKDQNVIEVDQDEVICVGVGVKTGGSRVGGPELCVQAGW